jgi:hypothetical protein
MTVYGSGFPGALFAAPVSAPIGGVVRLAV